MLGFSNRREVLEGLGPLGGTQVHEELARVLLLLTCEVGQKVVAVDVVLVGAADRHPRRSKSYAAVQPSVQLQRCG